MTLVKRVALFVALAIAPAALPCSYSAGHYPGWLEHSTAERLVQAKAIVVGIGTGDGSVEVERVLFGPPELLHRKLAPIEWVIMCPGDNAPEVPAGQRQLVSVWGEPGNWSIERVRHPFAGPGPFDDAATPLKVELAEEVIALAGAPSLLEAMRKRSQTATPALAPLWASLIDEQARSIAKSRPFAELKAIYDRAPRGEDPTRVRALDAMCMGDHREAITIERAIFAAADDFDLIPAALRCALRFKDRAALSQIVALAPAISADNDRRWAAHERDSDMMSRDMESGRSGASMTLIEAFLCLATEADSKLALELLKGEDRHARGLATRYFSSHPTPAALAIVRAKAGRFGDEHRGLTVALAALGDPAVVTWALGPHATEEDGWVASEVLEESPLPAARVSGVAYQPHLPSRCAPP
jgi:hypothetical protein